MAIIERRRKSEKLTADEKRALKKWLRQQETQRDALEELGFAKSTLDRVLVLGKGNPETIRKIRDKITPVPAA